ncbi:MAG: serine/threonine-protein kinase [Vulcanimicrobiota bacterium]
MYAQKVLRTGKTLPLVWLLFAICHAQQPATRPVAIYTQSPPQIRYRPEDGGNWIELGRLDPQSPRIELPRIDLRVEFSYDHWLYASLFSRKLDSGDDRITLRPEDFHNEPKWARIVAMLALGLAGAGGLVRRLTRSDKLATGTNQEPLIRPDGKVPKRKVGEYKLTGILGTGGMGVVYQAEDEEKHQVAIKVPAPHLVSQNDFHQRFLREIELGLKLRHQRVVKVLEMPLGDELYVVMEYVEGTPLDKLPLQPWTIEWKRCLEWAAQTLEALVYIHAQGVIHRDLKPSNLMVLPDNSIKLMDFGIAHKIHGTRLTGTDSIMGTPVYMAPEQLQGAEIDPRADLFSLGLILYERLKPGLPYSDDLIETLRQKISQPMTSLRLTNPSFPSAFDEFILTLLALKPEERFPDANAALAALKPLLTLTKR